MKATIDQRGAQERENSNPSQVALTKITGINRQTYRRIGNKVHSKRDVLDIDDDSKLSSQLIQ